MCWSLSPLTLVWDPWDPGANGMNAEQGFYTDSLKGTNRSRACKLPADWTHGSLYPSAGMREQDWNLDLTTAPRWPIVCDAGPTWVHCRKQACFLLESTDSMLLDCICIRVSRVVDDSVDWIWKKGNPYKTTDFHWKSIQSDILSMWHKHCWIKSSFPIRSWKKQYKSIV